MSARIPLKMALLMGKVSAEDADGVIDEYRAEVRREDAVRLLNERGHHASRAIFCDGIAHAARLLEQWAGEGAEEATPDFFQVGHTYTSGRWTFRCLTVAPSPGHGEPRALGFSSRNLGVWIVAGLDPDDWARGEWTEVAGGGAADA
jgi:hypothetical protein